MLNIGDVAKAYFHAAERCEEFRQVESDKLQMLLIPAVSNRAFASELYLKALLELQGVTGRGHDLHALFRKLAEQRKVSIRGASRLSLVLFDHELKQNSQLFVDWRYLYEKPPEKFQVSWQFLHNFSSVLRVEYESAISA